MFKSKQEVKRLNKSSYKFVPFKKMLFKVFIESQFKHRPLVFHGRQINNKVNKLHERALRIVYYDTVPSF